MKKNIVVFLVLIVLLPTASNYIVSTVYKLNKIELLGGILDKEHGKEKESIKGELDALEEFNLQSQKYLFSEITKHCICLKNSICLLNSIRVVLTPPPEKI